MSTRKQDHPLQALHHALTTFAPQHLDDAQLAELATTEATGENLETRYPEETAHLETCAACATSYAELLELTLTAFEGMAALPAPVSPREGYTAHLLQKLRTRFGNVTEWSDLAQTLADALPRHFPYTPTEADFTERFLGQLPTHPALPLAHLSALLRDDLRALTLYLHGLAETLWGTPTRLATENLKSWVKLQLTLTPQPVVPILGETKITSSDWTLIKTRAGQPLPLNVTLHAQRLSPLACRVEVSLDRPGLTNPSGRGVELRYSAQTLTAQTDPDGRVRFEPIPIAALPDLEIRFQV